MQTWSVWFGLQLQLCPTKNRLPQNHHVRQFHCTETPSWTSDTLTIKTYLGQFLQLSSIVNLEENAAVMILCNWIWSDSHAQQTCKYWKYTLQKNRCIRKYIITHISIIAALKPRDVPATNTRPHFIGFLGADRCRLLGTYHLLKSKKKKY